VGRIQGAARGGGVGLTAAVDIAVASVRASFALTEVRLGLLPGVISPFVVERMGPSHARALFMTGETIDAPEAHRVGLVHKLVAHDDLDAAVDRVVQHLVQGGPEALLACKRLVDTVAFVQPEQVFEQTVDAIAERRASAEAMEGMMAFLEKRKANWIP
jgi:methylglutaconyl-CoA hydratase